MKNMNDMLRQASIMQNKLAKLQEEMEEQIVESSAGGGMVKVSMNGKQELKSITIDPQVAGDVEMLQDLIISAVNEAGRIAKANMNRELGKLSGGIHLPGLF
ncbi:MAG: YbaB/EbfC family nucleoid-associated protein [Mailhella sp.]|nr:YbaB/EbfC family nucleoid-associated protein [Mailhella sp.]